MKKILILLFLNSIFGFSQTKELCDLVFSKKENFDIIEIFKGKIPNKFRIIDTTETWNPQVFYLENLNLNDKNVLAEIEKEEHHPYHYSYLFSNKLLDVKLNETEKISLSKKAQKSKSTKIQLKGENYETVERFKQKKGFYFLIAEPIYSEGEKFAFLAIIIKNKGLFLGEDWDEYYGVLTIMFEKNADKKWNQIGIKKHLIL
jgi:hypothetical protein